MSENRLPDAGHEAWITSLEKRVKALEVDNKELLKENNELHRVLGTVLARLGFNRYGLPDGNGLIGKFDKLEHRMEENFIPELKNKIAAINKDLDGLGGKVNEISRNKVDKGAVEKNARKIQFWLIFIMGLSAVGGTFVGDLLHRLLGS